MSAAKKGGFVKDHRIPDWQDVSQYPDPEKTTAKQWAWEFLRRNPKYQSLWEELIAPYVLPNGGFDTEAAMLVTDKKIAEDPAIREALTEGWPVITSNESPSALFERIFGIRSMYTLPHPAESQPKDISFVYQWMSYERWPTPEYKTRTPRRILKKNEACIYFNLEWPVSYQIAKAKEWLKNTQKYLKDDGVIDVPVKYSRRGELYQTYLRLLDGDARGASYSQMQRKINYFQRRTANKKQTARDSLTAAMLIRDKGYLFIAMHNVKKPKV